MRWYWNPMTLAKAGRGACQLLAARGPAAVRVRDVGRPTGWLVPAVPVSLEIVGRDGRVIAVQPDVPLPLWVGWTYRAGETLRIPPFRR